MTHLSTKFVLTLCGAILACSAVAGCGSRSTNTYCADLAASDGDYLALSAGDSAQLNKTLAHTHTLAKEAPDAVADDWKVVDSAVRSLRKNLSAGDKDSAGLGDAIAKLSSTEFVKATRSIAKHAQAVCKLDLTG